MSGADEWERLWAPFRMAYIEGENKPTHGEAGDDCPFCRSPGVDGEHSLVVARGEHAYVVLNLYPYNSGHVMVCPYRHVSDFTELTDGETRQIAVAATAVNAANDIVVKLFGPGGALLASGDLGTSPETLTYAPGGTIPKGVYHAQVCPFDDPTVPFLPPGTYAGAVTSSDSSAETPSRNSAGTSQASTSVIRYGASSGAIGVAAPNSHPQQSTPRLRRWSTTTPRPAPTSSTRPLK